MVTIKTVSNRLEAEIIKSLLASHGIDALVFADDQGGMQPALSAIHGVELRVQERDAYRARAILSDLAEAAENDGG
jgi:hypothetical protein